MSAVASQITSLMVVYSTVYSGADHRKHESSASLALCVVNSPETSKFPAQRASNAENVSIWWRHHDFFTLVFDINIQYIPRILKRICVFCDLVGSRTKWHTHVFQQNSILILLAGYVLFLFFVLFFTHTNQTYDAYHSTCKIFFII